MSKSKEKGDGKENVLSKVNRVHDRLQTMLEKDEPLPPLLDRPDLKPRWVGALIDFFAAAIVVFIFSVAGMFFGFYGFNLAMIAGAVIASFFILGRDGFVKSASPGKMAVGLRVADEDGHFIGISHSAKRNLLPALPFLVVVLYGVLNLFYDFIGSLGVLLSALAGLASIAACIYEIYRLLLDRKESRRWGDLYAGTKVIDLED